MSWTILIAKAARIVLANNLFNPLIKSVSSTNSVGMHSSNNSLNFDRLILRFS